MKVLKKIRVILYSVYFNFRYLPFKQALVLPIFIYKIDFFGGGKIVIDSLKIKRGMVKLGFRRAATFPNTGLSLLNKGKIIFKGQCVIGNDCSISVDQGASVVFGDDFKVNAGLRLESHSSIVFGNHVLIGWEVTFIDTKPEYCTNTLDQNGIEIGHNNWLSTRCLVLGAVKTPDNCVFGAYSIIKPSDCSILQPYCLFGNEPLRLLRKNVMRNYTCDLVIDYSINY